jgi:broad specificity phosphatase PhoE
LLAAGNGELVDDVTTVLLVRHTEVENPERLLYGRLPRFGLSARGREQAEVTADFLTRYPLTAIYSSPLLRARQTAEIIARRHPAATRHQSALLHEVRSAWQGQPFQSFASGFSTYDNRRSSDDESIEDIRQRMCRFIARARQRHPGQTIVAVSHGDPITILRVAQLNKPITVAAIRGADYAQYGSVTEITTCPETPPRITLHTIPIP